MNQYPTLVKLRPLLRMEVAVLIAALLVVVVGFNQYQGTQDAESSETDLDRKVTAVRDDLRFWDTSHDSAALAEQMAQLQEADPAQDFPSLERALKLGVDMLTYSAGRSVTLPVFSKEERSTLLAEEEFLTIHYSMLAQGSSTSLVGMLELLLDVPAISVRVLEFVGPVEGLANWEMTLAFDVLYMSETGEEA